MLLQGLIALLFVLAAHAVPAGHSPARDVMVWLSVGDDVQRVRPFLH